MINIQVVVSYLHSSLLEELGRGSFKGERDRKRERESTRMLNFISAYH